MGVEKGGPPPRFTPENWGLKAPTPTSHVPSVDARFLDGVWVSTPDRGAWPRRALGWCRGPPPPSDVLERLYTVGGGGAPPLDNPPPPPLSMLEAQSQDFALAPLAPRGFKLQTCWPAFGGDHRGALGGGGSQPTPPPFSDPPLPPPPFQTPLPPPFRPPPPPPPFRPPSPSPFQTSPPFRPLPLSDPPPLQTPPPLSDPPPLFRPLLTPPCTPSNTSLSVAPTSPGVGQGTPPHARRGATASAAHRTRLDPLCNGDKGRDVCVVCVGGGATVAP